MAPAWWYRSVRSARPVPVSALSPGSSVTLSDYLPLHPRVEEGDQPSEVQLCGQQMPNFQESACPGRGLRAGNPDSGLDLPLSHPRGQCYKDVPTLRHVAQGLLASGAVLWRRTESSSESSKPRKLLEPFRSQGSRSVGLPWWGGHRAGLQSAPQWHNRGDQGSVCAPAWSGHRLALLGARPGS